MPFASDGSTADFNEAIAELTKYNVNLDVLMRPDNRYHLIYPHDTARRVNHFGWRVVATLRMRPEINVVALRDRMPQEVKKQ